MKKFPALLLLVILLALSLAACGEDMPAPPEEGFSVSGIVLADGEPLPGVTVLADGEKVGETDEYGVYSVTVTEKYAVLAFEKEGYVFSPDSYTVTGDANDYNVTASLAPETDEPSPPDIPDEPDEPDVPDLPDLPDDPDDPEPPAPLPLDGAYGFYAAYAADGSFMVGFAADTRTETVSLSVAFGDTSLSASAAVKDGSIDFDGVSLPFSAETASDRINILADVTSLAELAGGSFTLTVTLSAEGMTSSTSSPFSCSFALAPPSISEPTLTDGILSWRVSGLPEECEFVLLVNGIVIARTPDLSFDISSLTIPDGATLRVAALSEDLLLALSPSLTL